MGMMFGKHVYERKFMSAFVLVQLTGLWAGRTGRRRIGELRSRGGRAERAWWGV